MNASALIAAREALARLGDALGIAPGALGAAEDLDTLVFRDERWPRARLDALSPTEVRALARAAPGTATLAQGDVDVLPLGSDDASWERFREVTRGNPWLTLTVTVDKGALGAGPGQRVVLHAEVLTRLWSAGPAAIEAAIPDPLPVTIRVGAPGLALAGAGFAIGDAAPARDPDADAWIARARPHLRWGDGWAARLSPRDLLVDGAPHDLRDLTRRTAVEAAVRSVADVVTGDGAGATAWFVSRGLRVAVAPRIAGEISTEAAAAWVRLSDWAFAAPFTPERLGVIRATVADAVGSAEPADRGRRLVAEAEQLEQISYDRFQGFVEQRLDLWAAEVRRLDEEVARAIAAYTDEIAAMVKDLSDTALAAVGVLVASIVASTARSDPGPVLPVMLAAYALYIVVFPWWMRLGWHRERDGLVRERLDGILDRYRAVLGRTRVDALVGDRVARARAVFVRWDRRTQATYVALTALALLGAGIATLR